MNKNPDTIIYKQPWYKEESLDHFSLIQFLLLHISCLLVIWTGTSYISFIVCLILYFVRLFAITAGYHRYFSHRSYKTGRFFQFILALIGTMAYQKGPLWWAANHRYHHIHSDTDQDVHSPVKRGFWWSHCGWFLCHKNGVIKEELIPNLIKYRELQFLDRFYILPPIFLCIFLYALGNLLDYYMSWLNTNGFQMLVWGFFISTVLVHHATFTATSLSHMFGKRRFRTKDESRNNFLLALITLGEGWHNNHHYYPSSERQGFYWWEVDFTHYTLKLFSWIGIVWNLKVPPKRVYLEHNYNNDVYLP